ncbi:LOW QUALITY PROTEIN: uncharacterized protein RCH25_048888 [Pelodytes ibericus]
MERKTLRVDGIPSDIPTDRAKDKLIIHFLRSRNGGGELDTIELFPGPPSYALITFQEDRVAERVLRIKDHTLLVNEMSYDLNITEVCHKLQPDKIFYNSSISVDYKAFPEHCKNILRSLSKTHTDVSFNFYHKEKTCVLSGAFTKIQALTKEILSLLDIESPKDWFNTTSKEQSDHQSQTRPSSIKQNQTNTHTEDGDLVHSSHYAMSDLKDYTRTDPCEQYEEPFVWDTDIYSYIQKFHYEEYQHILSKHQVQAVEASADGITTLYLQPAEESSRPVMGLIDSRYELLVLYQLLENKLRKELISKRDVKGDKEFVRKLLREIKKLFPLLLCHDDEKYINFIGESLDVGQAKQHINTVQYQLENIKPSKTSKPFPHTQISPSKENKELLEVSKPITVKDGGFEVKSENKIAAKFQSPLSPISVSKRTSAKEKHIESPTSNDRGQQDKEFETLPKDKDYGVLRPKEKFDGKYMTANQSWDTNPLLRSLKEERKQHPGTSRRLGPVKPAPSMKASSDVPYSSLIDLGSYPTEYKLPETKLRRSNSFSRIYSKENSICDNQHDVAHTTFTDIFVDPLLWSYLKDIYKFEIESSCTDIALSEEQHKDVIKLKFQAPSRQKLYLAKEHILSLCGRESSNISVSSFTYAMLQVNSPDDVQLNDLYNVFSKCSNKLQIRFDKDGVHLTHPKEMHLKVHKELSQFLQGKNKDACLSPPIATNDNTSLENVTDTEKKTKQNLIEKYTDDKDSGNFKKMYTLSEAMSNKSQPQTLSLDTKTEAVIVESDLYPEMNVHLEQQDQKKHFSVDSETLSSIDYEKNKQDLSPNPDLGKDSENAKRSNLFSHAKHSKSQTHTQCSDMIPQDVINESNQEILLVENLYNPPMSAMSDNETSTLIHNEVSNFFKNITAFEKSSVDSESPLNHKHFQDNSKDEKYFEDPEPYKIKSVLPSKFQFDNRTKNIDDPLKAELLSYSHNHDPYHALIQQMNYPLQNVDKNVIEPMEEKRKENIFLNSSQMIQENLKSSELRSPAVGQEAEPTDKMCDNCKKDNLTVKISCGHYVCSTCASPSVDTCQLCLATSTPNSQITAKATMTITQMSLCLQGFDRDLSLKIIYDIPDGVQGVGHPHPGCPYKGGRFEAYLPDNRESRKLVLLLKKAFKQGLSFQIRTLGSEDKVVWSNIPHKSSPDGGKAKNGYPDSTYMKCVFKHLKEYGIE